jgi:hypothetical protein
MAPSKTRYAAFQGAFLALAIFGASRIVVVGGLAFSAAYLKPNPGPGLWTIAAPWWRYLLRFDSAYYLDIARVGYRYNGNPQQMQSIVFFPGYPLLVRAAAWILPISIPFSAVFVPNLCAAIAIVLLYQLAKRLWDHDVALATVAIVSLFPTSLFLSTAYSESAALLFTVAAFWFLFRDRLWLAAICAGLLSGTRPIGFVLAIPLIYEVWLRAGKRFSVRFIGRAAAVAVTATSGLIGFALYCWIKFHDPLAFVHARMAWHDSSGLLGGALAWRQLHDGIGDVGSLFQPDLNDGWFFLAFLAIAIVVWRRIPAALNLYTAASFLVLIATRIIGELGFTSMNRYLLLVFPCMAGIALLTAHRTWLMVSLSAVFGAMLLMYSAMFAQWYWAG